MRSVGPIAAGFITIVVLSLATDQLLHVLEVYPPWGQPMHDPGDNLLALATGSSTASSAATLPPGSRRARRCGTR